MTKSAVDVTNSSPICDVKFGSCDIWCGEKMGARKGPLQLKFRKIQCAVCGISRSVEVFRRQLSKIGHDRDQQTHFLPSSQNRLDFKSSHTATPLLDMNLFHIVL